ncbi:MAG: creatininase family protein [Bacteroidales bacterium]|jgi:creatinine amidohydrolase|nr:creatininase family protein [Bacteroidales bacterium]
MKRLILFSAVMLITLLSFSQADPGKTLPVRLEELSSPQFSVAVEKSGGVCVIPLGVIEKHGTHLPLGTDMFEARESVTQAAEKEYAVVFPPYFAGQIFEARHQPGTIAYSNDLLWQMLDETCRELARNGLKKIILFNGHGGNTSFLQYFCQSQLSAERDYIVVLFQGTADPELDREIESLKKAAVDGHAGEEETSMMFYIRPDLVNRQAIGSESGASQARLSQMKNGYTGIWWYARYPNHYAGDPAQPDKRLGELLVSKDAAQLIELIKYLKSNNEIERLQNEFYDRAETPLKKQ